MNRIGRRQRLFLERLADWGDCHVIISWYERTVYDALVEQGWAEYKEDGSVTITDLGRRRLDGNKPATRIVEA